MPSPEIETPLGSKKPSVKVTLREWKSMHATFWPFSFATRTRAPSGEKATPCGDLNPASGKG